MNKTVNIFLFLCFIPTLFLSIIISSDASLPFINTSGENITYKEVYFIVLGMIIIILNFKRSNRRWSAIKIVYNPTKYKWKSEISSQRIKRVYTYNILEAFLMSVAGVALLKITVDAWLPAIGYIISSIDAVIFVLYGASTNRFRTVITDKALIANDREVILIYFNGLRKISFQQQTVFFDFKNNDLQLQLPIDYIPEAQRKDFFTVLKSCVDLKKVYFSDNLPINK